MTAVMKTCAKCWGVHPVGTRGCPLQPKSYKQYKKDTVANQFRKTNKWRVKSEKIRYRDKFLCQVCLTKKYDTVYEYTYDNLEVHHITPLKEAQELGLDDNNLITLCAFHHKIADAGTIPRKELSWLVQHTPLPIGH